MPSNGCNGSKYDSLSAPRPSRRRKRSTAGQLTFATAERADKRELDEDDLVARSPAVNLDVQIGYQPQKP